MQSKTRKRITVLIVFVMLTAMACSLLPSTLAPADAFNNDGSSQTSSRPVANSGEVTRSDNNGHLLVKDADGDQPNFLISGRVIDADSREPLSGVELNTNLYQSEIYSDGSFILTQPDSSSFDLLLLKNGYSDMSVTIEPSAKGYVHYGDIRLEPKTGSSSGDVPIHDYST